MRIPRGVRYLRLRRGVREDVVDEIEQHLSITVEELVAAGMEPEAARREAERRFGELDRYVADCTHIAEAGRMSNGKREFWQGIRMDVQVAVRGLRASPVLAVVAVLTLGLGIGVTTGVFTLVSALLLRPLPYPDGERLVTVAERRVGLVEEGTSTSYPNYDDWKARASSFESLAIATGASLTMIVNGEAMRLSGAYVTAEMFDVFGVHPVIGRRLTPADNVEGAEWVALLSYGLWQDHYGGDRNIVGQRITLGTTPHTVIGVLPRGFKPPGELDADYWGNTFRSASDARTSRYLQVWGKLRPGRGIEGVRAEMAAIGEDLAREYPQENRDMMPHVEPLRDALYGDTRRPLLVLLAAAVVVLLIACANLSGLLVARAHARVREFAVRAALGASARRLVRQLLTESAVLSLAGGIAGVGLAIAIVAVVIPHLPEVVRTAGVQVDARVLVFACLATMGTVVLFGLMPALNGGRVQAAGVLRQDRRGTTGGGRGIRHALVVMQIALAVVLMFGSGLLVRSFERLLAIDPGIDARNVLVQQMQFPGRRYPAAQLADAVSALETQIASVPGVDAVTTMSIVPFGGSWDRTSTTTRPGDTTVPQIDADRYVTTPSFFATLGIRLLHGRVLNDRDRAGAPPVVVIDEQLARRFGFAPADAIGERIYISGDTVATEIVGVVQQVRHYGLDVLSEGQIILPIAQRPWRFLAIAVRTRDEPLEAAASVRAAIRAFDPELAVFNTAALDDLLDERSAMRRLLLGLFLSFGAIASALAMLGLYGVIAYGVTNRRRELGIRLALGALPRSIALLVLGEGARLTTLGVIAGALLALPCARLMQHLLFETEPFDAVAIVTVGALLAITALLASWLPARRAARVDPLESLR